MENVRKIYRQLFEFLADRQTKRENIERPPTAQSITNAHRTSSHRLAAETSDSTFKSDLLATAAELLAASCDITCERGADLLQQVRARSFARSCVRPQMTDRQTVGWRPAARLTYGSHERMNAQTITSATLHHGLSGSCSGTEVKLLIAV